MIKNLSTLFLDLLFPRLCISCKKEYRDPGLLCNPCVHSIPISSGLVQEQPFQLRALSSYQNQAVKSLILELKFNRQKSALYDIHRLIEQYFKTESTEKYDLLLPVPASEKTLRSRGFNQAELIAELFQNLIQSTIYSKDLLRRTKHRPSQSQMKNFQERWENISRAFALQEPALLKERSVLLVDDVYTSGATIHELRKLLLEAGAKKVDALVLAKA